MLYNNGKQHKKIFLNGKQIRTIYKNGKCIYPGVAYGPAVLLSNLNSFLINLVDPEGSIIQRSLVPLDQISPSIDNIVDVSDPLTSKYPIYMGSTEGIIYWYCENPPVFSNTALALGEAVPTLVSRITSIEGLRDWDVSKATDLSNLLSGMGGLQDISPLSSWDVHNVTNMMRAFRRIGCDTLYGLDAWDVSKVTDMTYAFQSARISTVDNIADWNLQSVVTMSHTFEYCSSLSDISGLSDWNVSNVTDMQSLFNDCYALTDISPLSQWDTHSVQNMTYMFSDCKLSNISYLSNWDVSGVRTFSEMFLWDRSLKSLNGLQLWDVSNATSFIAMFGGCSTLTDISQLSNWNVSNATNFQQLFYQCLKLSDISSLSSWNPISVTNMYGMFQECSELTDASSLYGWHLPNLDSTGMTNTFRSTSIAKFDFSQLYEISNLTLIDTFYRCRLLTICDLGDGISKLEGSYKFGHYFGTFAYCNKLATLVIRRTSSVIEGSSIVGVNQYIFIETILKSSEGKVYVPQSILADYQNDSFWNSYLWSNGCQLLPLEGSPYEQPGSI